MSRSLGAKASLPSFGEALRRAAAERTAHLVTVLGPAGIGKSRLAQELALGSAARQPSLPGRCLPYGDGITFWPLREIVGQLTAERSPSVRSRRPG